MNVYPLANPKGVKLRCELCEKPGYLVCGQCQVTYYCCHDHQLADKESIHGHICDKLAILRQPAKFLPSEELRQKWKKQMRDLNLQIIDTAATRARHLLFQGLHEKAVPAALVAVRFCLQQHGPSSIELVPAYLCLGEACIGLRKLGKAEEYLSQANWIAITDPNCPSSIMYNLHRNLGLLYAAKGDYSEALRHFADDIYHASEEFGTNSLKTSGGHYHMANVFFRQSKMDIARSIYRQVTKIWHKYLSEIATNKMKQASQPQAITITVSKDERAPGLNEWDEAEAVQVLCTIYDIWESSHKKCSKDLAETSHALAMLYYILGQYDKAREYGNKAYATCENTEYAKEISEFLDCLKRSQT